MNALTITPAALHAALAELRLRTHDAETAQSGWRRAIDGLGILCVLLDPAHAGSAPRAAPRNGLADGDAPPVTTMAPDAVRDMFRKAPLTAQWIARTEAAPGLDDPPIDIPPLPAGPGRAGDTACSTPAAEAAEMPTAPAPAPPPVPAAEGSLSPPAALPPPTRRGQGARTANVWTPERKAMMAARYPHEGVAPSLMRDLNALPGPEVTPQAVKSHAHAMNLRLTPEAFREIMAARAAAARDGLARKRLAAETAPPAPVAEAPQAPEPEADPPPVPATPRAPIVEAGDERADAFAYFDSGKFVRDVVADFGVTLTEALGWHADWKRQKGSEPT
jgi:hypothetical protein